MALRSFAVVLIVPLAATCGPDDRGTSPYATTYRDSSGVELVEGPAADTVLGWRFDPVVSLGGADQGPEAFFGLRRRGVAVGPGGRLHVLDAGNHRVAVFDSSGEFVRSMGSEGGGPGELLRPRSLAVTPDGETEVLDIAKQAVIRFGPDGRPLDARPLEIRVSGEGMEHSRTGIVTTIAGGYRQASDSVSTLLLVLEADGDTTVLEARALPRPEMVEYGCASFPLHPLFTAELAWDHARRITAVTRGDEYIVTVFRDDSVVRRLRRPVPAQPAGREMALAVLGEEDIEIRTPAGNCSVTPEEMLAKRGRAEHLPSVADLAVAPDGSLWVRRGAAYADSARVDVFGPDGTYRGTLSPDSPWPVAFLDSRTIVTLEADDLDRERVVAYRVEADTSNE